jgi:hypothetical protein
MAGKHKPLLIVLGMMGRTPFAGVAWQVLHYLEGFRRLGYDVYYVEDTGDWPYDPEQNTVTGDPRYTVQYVHRQMAWAGMPERWAYRAESQNGRYHGLPEEQVNGLFERADVLVNLTGATVLRAEHLRVPVRIYLETDPVLPQIEVAQGRSFTIELLDVHTHHFTYGENLGAPDCGVPVGRYRYFPTRQPIVLDWWSAPAPQAKACWTTIASWEQQGKDVEWQGETYYWSKHLEFLKLLDLPKRSGQPLELALARCDAKALRLLKSHGWRTRDALALSKEDLPYRDFFFASRGEFTVAKDQNVRLRSGWFSDRSACYLACGRPVVTQDTGFGNVLPTGRGLFAFRTMDDVLAAFDAVASDYDGHCRAAREIAADCFAAEKVLGRLLADAGLS